jgi:hypothetical protein
MALSKAQQTTLRNALAAETNPTVVDALAIRNDVALTEWCNGASATDAWIAYCDRRTMFESMDVTKYDGLTAGKRDAWRVMMENGPLDFGRNKLRTAVVDVWGNVDSVNVLTNLREKATRAEAYIGGAPKTTNTISAIDRAYVGALSINEVSVALNG